MKKVITEQELIAIANSRLVEMSGYEDGMKIHSARMEKNILVIESELFLSADGGATSKTVEVLPLYEALSKELGSQYEVF